MAAARDGVYIWVTWVSKVMAGEQSCEWASWFKAHNTYAKLPSDFNQAGWTIEHTRKLRELQVERRKLGEQVSVEAANSIKYCLSNTVTLAGKPDLIGVAKSGATIFDVKTGQPKTSDSVQVMIYMHLVPLVIPRYSGTRFAGCVVYNENRVVIPPEAIDATFLDNFRYFLDIIGGVEEPLKSPSATECRFCDIPKSECAERYVEIANTSV